MLWTHRRGHTETHFFSYLIIKRKRQPIKIKKNVKKSKHNFFL
jgi:hypothetical protein